MNDIIKKYSDKLVDNNSHVLAFKKILKQEEKQLENVELFEEPERSERKHQILNYIKMKYNKYKQEQLRLDRNSAIRRVDKKRKKLGVLRTQIVECTTSKELKKLKKRI